ncbi:hypothetical protein [Acidovorax soli]|uniref:Uncharacterized protein n=1 Tax=Acidovorax soli TaxID=592050 RepID=A0A1H4F4G7_9BURK|nr:hypothetical protein [Acidovorax soli]SEA91817.1 hypothetical protein SAMN05421875_14712 [Acidovorax soli]
MAKQPAHRGPLRDCPKFDELGGLPGISAALRQRSQSLDWPQGARTLEMQLGLLDRGDSVWWRNRPEHAQSLADLLELELSDLGITDSPSPGFMEFTQLFGMPPLDLRKGYPWNWSAEKRATAPTSEFDTNSSLEEWLRPTPYAFRPPHEVHWLTVADELERQVLIRSVEAAGHFSVISVSTLDEAAGRLASYKPLVIAVEQFNGDEDWRALAKRPSGAGLLVIAPCDLPMPTEGESPSYWSWERLNQEEQEVGVTRWVWARSADWRARFLRWLESHFIKSDKDTLYSAKGMGAWLERFDPCEEWFGSVADLLPVCLGFENEKKLPSPNATKAGEKLLRVLQRSQRRMSPDMLRELSLARWGCRETAWSGVLPMQAWAGLMQGNSQASAAIDLDSVVQGKTLAERKRAAQELQHRQPLEWVRNGLLKAVDDGYDFQQQSLVKLLVRDALLGSMDAGSVEDWAWACFDAQRRGLVDAALDALDATVLQELTSRTMELEHQSTEFIGASDALFCAVGRRIARGNEITEIDAFLPLGCSVIHRLNMADVAWALPAPWTRPVDMPDQQLDWISVCWAWSLMPAPQILAEANWLFPGWGSVADIQVPWWLADLWPEKGAEQLPMHWQRFFLVADEWIKELDHPLPDVPRLLQIAHLGKAAAGGWSAEVAWWQGLWPNESGEFQRWIDQTLIAKFQRSAAENAAKHVWPSYAEWERLAQDKYGFKYLRPMRRWLLEMLPAAWVLEQLDETGRCYFASCPQTLPPQWRGPLLLSVKEQWATVPAGKARDFLRRYGSSIGGELAEVIESESTLAWAAGSLIWAWNGAKARELLKQPDRLEASAWRILFDNCPTESLSLALDVLRKFPEMIEANERLEWARSRLPSSGIIAKGLLELMRASTDENF